MKALRQGLSLALVAGMLVGCATSRIVSTDPSAELYVDGTSIGLGSGEISRMGFPHTAQIEARKSGRVIAQGSVSRSITGTTFLVALVSYGTGLIWGWNYPDSYILFVPYAHGHAAAPDPWSTSPLQSGHSAWTQPGVSAGPAPASAPTPAPVANPPSQPSADEPSPLQVLPPSAPTEATLEHTPSAAPSSWDAPPPQP